MVHVLAVGDIIGRPGRDAVIRLLPSLRQELALDLVIANGENTAGGFGLTVKIADELFRAGVDVLTSGNHIYAQKEMLTGFPLDRPVLRPLNYPRAAPGRGWLVHDLGTKGRVLIANVIGRVFMQPLDSPFLAIDQALEEAGPVPVKVVDVHAEATSEKQALGWYLAGRASFVFGTHTHVPTADPRILPGGTAFCTDLGMVGPRDSVIGMDPARVLERFLSGVPYPFRVGAGPVQFNSVLARIDGRTGQALAIERVDRDVATPSDHPRAQDTGWKS
jgi:metallophosphoesterase (TIGR00282 family)